MRLFRRRKLPTMPPSAVNDAFRIIARAARYGIGDEVGQYFWLGYDAEAVR